ncbi:MAG TPA: hypothetical protein VGB02_00795 [Pyrinomonadaceae bacterium]|jgi:hypothetical protein
MSSQKTSAYHFFSMLLAIIFLCFCAGIKAVAQDEPVKLINELPKHLPLKIEIENADKEDLLRELRLKVTNESNKPIYYLDFFLEVADVEKTSGLNFIEYFWFGDREFRRGKFASEKDIPLKKGESAILKVPEDRVKGFNRMLERYSFTKPRRFILQFSHLSYGDGTGYHMLNAVPYPEKDSENKPRKPDNEKH